MDGGGENLFHMNKVMKKTALVLVALLMLAACDREAQQELNPITVIVTVESTTGKMISFFYRGEHVWAAGPVKSVSYHRNDDMTYIDYISLSDEDCHLVFQGGKRIK